MSRYALLAPMLIALGAVSGCSQPARTLATDLGRFTHAYDAARAAKAQTEAAYYAQQLQILRGAYGGSFVVPKEAGATIDKGVPVEHSIAYGRIVTGSMREAYLVAEALGTPGPEPQPASTLLKFLDQGLRDDREAFVAAQERQQQLRATLLADLEKIDRQAARLQTVLEQIKRLQQAPDLKATAGQLYAIGQAVQKQINEQEAAGQ